MEEDINTSNDANSDDEIIMHLKSKHSNYDDKNINPTVYREKEIIDSIEHNNIPKYRGGFNKSHDGAFMVVDTIEPDSHMISMEFKPNMDTEFNKVFLPRADNYKKGINLR